VVPFFGKIQVEGVGGRGYFPADFAEKHIAGDKLQVHGETLGKEGYPVKPVKGRIDLVL
jgi:hypothetical protein